MDTIANPSYAVDDPDAVYECGVVMHHSPPHSKYGSSSSELVGGCDDSGGPAAPQAYQPALTFEPCTASLMKLGGKGRSKSKWQERQYTITRSHLEWAVQGQSGTQLPLAQVVDIRSATESDENYGQPLEQIIIVQCAQTHKNGKFYYLCANSREEQRKWIDRVRVAKQLALSAENLGKYTPQDVGELVASISPTLRAFRHLFTEHHITGDLFVMLDDASLEKMGLSLVGPRLLVVKEIKRLQAQQRRAVREKVIFNLDRWEDTSDRLKHCRVGDLRDNYRLTSTNLVVTRTHVSTCCGWYGLCARVAPVCLPLVGCLCSCWTEKYQSKNSIDLSNITNVDSLIRTKRRCCVTSGHEEVHVSTAGARENEEAQAGWRNLDRLSRAGRDNEVLHVAPGKSAKVEADIRHWMEEKKGMGQPSLDMYRD